MGKRKRSRSHSQEKNEDLWKKLRKIEKKLKKREERPSVDSSPRTPPPPPVDPAEILPSEDTEDLSVEEIPEDLLQALGNEGEQENIVGGELQQQLADRWTNIIQQGLGKEARETLSKKYPSPANFMAAIPPIMNEEIVAAMNESSKKRDKRIVFRQTLLGKMLFALGKALTSVLKGNINTKEIVEQLSDSAKFAAEVFHQDSESRKFFALAGTSTVIKEAVKKVKTDEYLFGKNCGDLNKAAQTIQKTGSQIKIKPQIGSASQENWKSPLHHHPQRRNGKTHRAQVKTQPPQQTQRPQLPRKRPQPQRPSKQARDKYRRY